MATTPKSSHTHCRARYVLSHHPPMTDEDIAALSNHSTHKRAHLLRAATQQSILRSTHSAHDMKKA